jgi:hypothetical protein
MSGTAMRTAEGIRVIAPGEKGSKGEALELQCKRSDQTPGLEPMAEF